MTKPQLIGRLLQAGHITEEEAGTQYDLSDPARWYENHDPAHSAGPVDIYWIDDGDGPVKLSRAIKCF